MPDKKPNIMFIMPDQLRYDFLSCYGADFIGTPNMDRIAEKGVRFSRAYSEHPLCVPARVALMTGMHATQTGVLDNGQFLRADYAECGITPWARLISGAGYYTAAIGKMHFYPWDLRLGFQYRSICEDKRWIKIRDDYYHFLRARGKRKLHGNEHDGYFENKGAIVNRLPYEEQWDYFVGQEASRFIDTYGNDEPFFMMVGFPGPHCPYDPDKRFLDMFDPKDMPDPIIGVDDDVKRLREANIEGNLLPWNGVDLRSWTVEQRKKVRQHYAALVKQIDEQIGEIFKALERTGELDNTIIIFAADHGDYLGDHDMAGKGTFYEASSHVPMLVYLPWAEGGKVCDDLVCLSDVTATTLGFAGIERPPYFHSRPLPGLGVDGEAGTERGGRAAGDQSVGARAADAEPGQVGRATAAEPRHRIFGALDGVWCIFDGRYKLSKFDTGDVHLFDLENDPREQHNLAGDPQTAAIQADLDGDLTSRIMAGIRTANGPHRVYYSDLSQQIDFGREGWIRPFPRPVLEAYE